jgi:hypothetical protein
MSMQSVFSQELPRTQYACFAQAFLACHQQHLVVHEFYTTCAVIFIHINARLQQ